MCGGENWCGIVRREKIRSMERGMRMGGRGLKGEEEARPNAEQ